MLRITANSSIGDVDDIELDELDDDLNDDVGEPTDDDDGFCVACSGTGEGRYDGSSCSVCHGHGFIRRDPEFFEPDLSDYDYRIQA